LYICHIIIFLSIEDSGKGIKIGNSSFTHSRWGCDQVNFHKYRQSIIYFNYGTTMTTKTYFNIQNVPSPSLLSTVVILPLPLFHYSHVIISNWFPKPYDKLRHLLLFSSVKLVQEWIKYFYNWIEMVSTKWLTRATIKRNYGTTSSGLKEYSSDRACINRKNFYF
jgi:hypothetical protein